MLSPSAFYGDAYMYLGREHLLALADKLVPEVGNAEYPFERGQVRVCSIDIRVSNVFWVMKRKTRRPIDLGGQDLIFEISPRRHWERRVLSPSGYLDLKPGEMLLGRTHEKISMPKNLVGKINTRSSFARLGISTACNCDLINPGYVGHVPLEITNSTSSTIRVRPYLSLCQIFVLPIDGKELASYADVEFLSKYMDDDGGPSLWWRDELAQKVSRKISSISGEELKKLQDVFEGVDDDGLFRLELLLEKNSYGDAQSLLAAFSRRERSWKFCYVWAYRLVVAEAGWFAVWSSGPLVSFWKTRAWPSPNSGDLVAIAAFVLMSTFLAYCSWRGKLNFYESGMKLK